MNDLTLRVWKSLYRTWTTLAALGSAVDKTGTGMFSLYLSTPNAVAFCYLLEIKYYLLVGFSTLGELVGLFTFPKCPIRVDHTCDKLESSFSACLLVGSRNSIGFVAKQVELSQAFEDKVGRIRGVCLSDSPRKRL